MAMPTLLPMLRVRRKILTQGTAIFSLTRNIGGSVGIAIVEALLTENTQVVHSRLVEHLRPDNPLAQAPYLMPPFSLTSPTGVAALNAEATRQAAMVAYIDDFKMMMIIIMLALPLLLLLRGPRPTPAVATAVAEVRVPATPESYPSEAMISR